MKKLGIICKDKSCGAREIERRYFFKKHLNKKYELHFFQWEDINKTHITKSYTNESCKKQVPLKYFDLIYLHSLGAIENKKSKLISLIKILDSTPAIVINNPETMNENFDKRYLLFLQQKGIPVVPTNEVTGINYQDLKEVSFSGFENIVIKPKFFGERAKGVTLASEINSEEEFRAYLDKYGKQILAQPYLKEITEEGERSLIFVGNKFSHSIFRNRDGWNFNRQDNTPIIKPIKPIEEEIEIAKETLKVWPTQYHITRFDFIRNHGKPNINEVEMINPAIWIARGFKDIDARFIKIFKNYLNELI